jgi:hypothetical protein
MTRNAVAAIRSLDFEDDVAMRMACSASTGKAT